MNLVRTSLRTILDEPRPEALERWFGDITDPHERGEELAGLDQERAGRLAHLIGPAATAGLVESVDRHTAADFLGRLPLATAVGVLGLIRTDRAAAILREMPSPLVVEVLARMGRDRAAPLRTVLAHPPTTAGAHMTPVFIALPAETPAGEAIERVRESAADGAVAFTLYVTGDGGELLGVVAFRSLVLAPAAAPVAELMRTRVVTVAADADREEAARLLNAHDHAALPVVDDGRIIGVITADSVAEIVEEEATEDAERQGGSAPLDVPYLHASPMKLWRKRILWLLVLFAAEAYTGTVLRHFEEELEAAIALAFFIPLLIGTGGNTGTQITTTLVRAMATGEVALRDMGRVVRKEMGTGMLISMAMAGAAMIRAWMLGVGPQVTLVVVLSVAAIVLWSALVSSILPLVLRRVGIDPAVVSAPFIATLVDGTGLIIYFEIAKLVLW
ncbi:magnesium transporter [Nocardiopsis mwathae]|uniref:Magnesium transporter MgtE n=1 Tax=Nocardiopsis mwathae TaxID=1472723 RepID=A0A7W9YF27_9ACTN|nr:magnesium transporter [Nocardiopsis mwathae]MBB6170995.1 magnesium transporter [Nocardiopsis mwathae]